MTAQEKANYLHSRMFNEVVDSNGNKILTSTQATIAARIAVEAIINAMPAFGPAIVEDVNYWVDVKSFLI